MSAGKAPRNKTPDYVLTAVGRYQRKCVNVHFRINPATEQDLADNLTALMNSGQFKSQAALFKWLLAQASPKGEANSETQ